MTINTDLTDGTGFLWNIRNGGNIVNGTSDAYDGAFFLRIDGALVNPTESDLSEGGRELNTNPELVNGIAAARSIYVSDTLGYARYLDTFINTTNAPITFVVEYDTNLGADSSTTATNILIGAEYSDVIAASFDDASIGAGDPGTIFAWNDDIASVRGTYVPDTDALPDSVVVNFEVTLQPGETQRLLVFGAQTQETNPTAPTGSKVLTDTLSNINETAGFSNYLVGLTDEEMADVVNYDLSDYQTPEANGVILTDGEGVSWRILPNGAFFTEGSGEIDFARLLPPFANGINVTPVPGPDPRDEGGREYNFDWEVNAVSLRGSYSAYVSPDEGFLRLYLDYENFVPIASNIGILDAGLRLDSLMTSLNVIYETNSAGGVDTADTAIAFDDSASGNEGTLDPVSVGWGDGTASPLDTVNLAALGSSVALEVNDSFRRYDAPPEAYLYFFAVNDTGVEALADAERFANPGPELLAGLSDFELSRLANYTLDSDDRLEVTNGTSGDNVITGNNWGDRINGLGGNDEISGLGSNDIIDGGTGIDLMRGGFGDDLYFVDNEFDQVVELNLQGRDSVTSTATSTVLSSNVEVLTLSGAAMEGRGNNLDNSIIGNAENNMLYGLSGDDTIVGGAGDDHINGGVGADLMIGGENNDTYLVDNSGDLITENPNEGIDHVNASISLNLWQLSQHLETLTLTGSADIDGSGNARANTITGNSGNNTLRGGGNTDILIGGAGNDILDGQTGADQMEGGADDDTYFVDDVGDTIIESANGGIDHVNASITLNLWQVSQQLETLTLTGSSDIDGSGNSRDNTITGNSGSNVLRGGAGKDIIDGKGGADAMEGGTDDDTYFVDNAADTITENAGEGIDHVNASITLNLWQLSQQLETLTLTGMSDIDGSGNARANTITGNDGNNTLRGGGNADILIGAGGHDILDGQTGADDMSGGTGDDTYFVDDAGDTITENADEGTDSVNSSITLNLWELSQQLEVLNLTGTTDIDGAGNSRANSVTGNSGSNTIRGGGGNDILDGMSGNDLLIGGADSDTFVFSSALNGETDRIVDFNVVDDIIQLSGAQFAIGTGLLSASQFVIGTSATTSDHRIIYDDVAGEIFYDADGTGATAQIQFARISAGLSMTNADFDVL